MSLTGKYLKYDESITFKIFEEIWIKLISNGWKATCDFVSIRDRFHEFRNGEMLYNDAEDKKSFYVNYKNIRKYTEDTGHTLSETTVQEILGYDPFVKEEFAKTLFEPVRHGNGILDAVEPKQPLKQAVHCKTQKEWDFAKVLIGKIDGVIISKYDKISCCLNLNGETRASLDYYKSNNFQILSFQEWCDLNGYKMENKIKSNQEFKVGDWVIVTNRVLESFWSNKHKSVGYMFKISNTIALKSFNAGYPESTIDECNKFGINYQKEWLRHATPEEINNHLISIGQIPAGEPLNIGIEPNKDGAFKYTTLPGSSWSGGTIQNHLEAMIPTTGNCYNKDFATSYIPIKSKMILSIDDEELPMVNIIKTNSIKQLLNLE